jgi:hypothetical protein
LDDNGVQETIKGDFDQVGPLVLHAVLKLIIEFLSGRRAHCLYPILLLSAQKSISGLDRSNIERAFGPAVSATPTLSITAPDV